MVESKNRIAFSKALEDFNSARTKAELQRFWAAITGKSLDLWRFDEITKKLKTTSLSSKGLQEIPVDAIVGSVNRYQDFNRNFLPLMDEDAHRWAGVKAAMTSPSSAGLPPIRVYKIGDAYFVLDGNHRVSIAKEMELDTIEAYVTELRSKVSLSPDDKPEDIILKEEYLAFLEDTHIDTVLPGVDLQLTFPGQYAVLKEHIVVHRYYMGLEAQREISWEEAVRHWYETVYLPVIRIIREQGLLSEFPEQTETDLYLWVLDHQTYMEQSFGWSIRPDVAASDLAEAEGQSFPRVARRIGEKVMASLLPKEFEDFSKPGEWHAHKDLSSEHLFSDILVAFSPHTDRWIAMEQAIYLAQLEESQVRGLIVVNEPEEESERSSDFQNCRESFQEKLQQAGLTGELSITEGNVAETISENARVNDLVVLKLSYPPSEKFFARLQSGFRLILRRCSRPILVVRESVASFDRILLAYDGSPKSREALFVAAYLASRYNFNLTTMVANKDESRGKALLEEARNYLQGTCNKEIFVQPSDEVSQEILNVADQEEATLIIMGGYGFSPILEALFGSTVDGIIRDARIPILICQ